MSKRAAFLVRVDMPEGVTEKDMKEYIAQAVMVWCGSKDPDDAIWDLKKHNVKVTIFRKPKEKQK